MHDPRVGRFFAVDPLAKMFPWNSPYAFSENRLTDGVEFEGLEFKKIFLDYYYDKVVFELFGAKDVELQSVKLPNGTDASTWVKLEKMLEGNGGGDFKRSFGLTFSWDKAKGEGYNSSIEHILNLSNMAGGKKALDIGDISVLMEYIMLISPSQTAKLSKLNTAIKQSESGDLGTVAFKATITLVNSGLGQENAVKTCKLMLEITNQSKSVNLYEEAPNVQSYESKSNTSDVKVVIKDGEEFKSKKEKGQESDTIIMTPRI